MNCKNKSLITKHKAFTLIELLIVIAIIGILFIVLISKVDFATDKAKATGVQTDFRSFQVAIESVAKENAGLSTFGWDTGDANGDRIRNSYDKGDANKNGKQDEGEVFVGSKTYGETWTNIYTLTNPADANDKSAIIALEAAINKNLDPKLHITIHDNLTVTMANGAQDPWNTEYHGSYITNATVDNKDRGAIVIYSNGANQEWGSEHSIENGVVTVTVPGNNVYGKDDYSIAIVYTYVNGYGEVKTTTTGFSQNQGGGQAGSEGTFIPGGSGGGNGDDVVTPQDPDVTELLEPGLYNAGAIELAKTGDVEAAQDMIKTSWADLLTAGVVHVTDGLLYSNLDFDTWQNASSDALDGDLVLPNDGSITKLGNYREWWDENNNWFYDGQLAFTFCYNLTGIAIPKGVTSISNLAFYECTSLTSVTIGNGVTSIGEYAFQNCYGLTSITIPDSVTSIEDGAFYYCGLTSLTIGNGVIAIDDYAFFGCGYLESVYIPDSVTSIGKNVFEDCWGIKNVYITDIAKWCNISFDGYFSNPLNFAQNLYLNEVLVTEIIIPDGVTSIGNHVFSGCSSMTSVIIPDSVTSIGSYAFYNCRGLTNITIPDSVTSIDNCAFESCKGLESVYISDSVTSIGKNVFRDCSSLTSLNIPNSVTSIGECAFYDCSSLINVVIPDSVTELGYDAFGHCSSLMSVTIGNSVTSIDSMTFWGCNKLIEVINKSSLDIKAGKSSYGYVGYYAKEVHDGTTKIVNQNDYLFYTYGGVNCLVTYIGTNTELILPESYNGQNYEIYQYAFYDCTVLTSIVIPDSVTSIGDYAFKWCDSLTSIVIPDSVIFIGDDAFYGCDFTSITIPDGVTSISSHVFYACDSLTSVTIPDSVTSIGDYAFYYCNSLTSINFNGTKAEWSSISKGLRWKDNVPATYVQCTDGQVTL